MAAFTDATTVRVHFQMTDMALVPDSLITQAIAAAHDAILARLGPEYVVNPPARILLGETLLAGSHTLLMLASRDAIEQKQITLGGQRIEPGQRFDSLLTMAERAEQEGWDVMAPYLNPIPCRSLAAAMASKPVFGEE